MIQTLLTRNKFLNLLLRSSSGSSFYILQISCQLIHICTSNTSPPIVVKCYDSFLNLHHFLYYSLPFNALVCIRLLVRSGLNIRTKHGPFLTKLRNRHDILRRTLIFGRAKTIVKPLAGMKKHLMHIIIETTSTAFATFAIEFAIHFTI